ALGTGLETVDADHQCIAFRVSGFPPAAGWAAEFHWRRRKRHVWDSLYSVGGSGAGLALLLFPLEFAVFLVVLVAFLGDDEQANGGEDVFQHRWLLRGMRGAAAQAFQRLALASPRQPGCPGRGRAHDQVAVSAFG